MYIAPISFKPLEHNNNSKVKYNKNNNNSNVINNTDYKPNYYPLINNSNNLTFQATQKQLASFADGISLHVARSINESVRPMQTKVITFLNNTFGDLRVTELNPMNLIYKLKNRAKTPLSIMEKSATRQWNCKDEVLNYMTDLNGGKIVMRDSSRSNVESVLSRLIPLIQKGDIELLEIENKRPHTVKGLKGDAKTQYDYTSEDFLYKLQNIQEEKWENDHLKEERRVKLDMDDYTFVNYVAVHLLLKFPEEDRPFELMIMGKDVDTLKDLDDKLFKILNNKNIDKRYQPLIELVKPLKEPGNKELLEIFNQYRGDAFIFQRNKHSRAYSKDSNINYFLPLAYDLPEEYDLNNLYRIMQECDQKAERLAKQKRKAQEAQKVQEVKQLEPIEAPNSEGSKLTRFAKSAGRKIKKIASSTKSKITGKKD